MILKASGVSTLKKWSGHWQVRKTEEERPRQVERLPKRLERGEQERARAAAWELRAACSAHAWRHTSGCSCAGPRAGAGS